SFEFVSAELWVVQSRRTISAPAGFSIKRIKCVARVFIFGLLLSVVWGDEAPGYFFALRHAGIIVSENAFRVVQPDPCVDFPESESFRIHAPVIVIAGKARWRIS